MEPFGTLFTPMHPMHSSAPPSHKKRLMHAWRGGERGVRASLAVRESGSLKSQMLWGDKVKELKIKPSEYQVMAHM